MAQDIHPKLNIVDIKCSGCGNAFQVSINMKGASSLDIEVCNQCHFAYTGKRRASTAGKVEAFQNKYAGFNFTINKGDKTASK